MSFKVGNFGGFLSITVFRAPHAPITTTGGASIYIYIYVCIYIYIYIYEEILCTYRNNHPGIVYIILYI